MTHVEDFKAGDIEYTDEVCPLLFGVQGDVDLLHQPLEQPVKHCLSHGADRVVHLVKRGQAFRFSRVERKDGASFSRVGTQRKGYDDDVCSRHWRILQSLFAKYSYFPIDRME